MAEGGVMLGWFRRILTARPPARDDRAVFRFHDGERDREADPIQVYVELQKFSGGKLKELCRLVDAQPVPGMVGDVLDNFQQTRFDATVKLADVVCVAFGVKPYADGMGLTIPERIALATAYMNHMAALKEAAVPFAERPGAEPHSPA